MDILHATPSESEVLEWFFGYENAFDLNQDGERLVKNASDLYTNVFEQFSRARRTAGRNSSEVNEDLRVFGFDYFDFHSEKPTRFYSKYNVPEEYQPLPSSGHEFPEDLKVVWPADLMGRRWLASYIRNSSAHRTTYVKDGIVNVENRKSGDIPNFHIFLPVKEYVRLLAGSLKYFVENVVQDDPYVNKLGSLSTAEYSKLVGFFQKLLKDLPTAT
jgi:hypothetical protein